MSLKMESHAKLKVTQNLISREIECNSKCNVTQDGMSLKIECHSKLSVTQKLNFTQNRMSLTQNVS